MNSKPAVQGKKPTFTIRLARLLLLLPALSLALHDAKAGATITLGADNSSYTDPTDYLTPAVSDLIKVGTGTITLTGNSTYTDGTTLNSGGLYFGSNTAIGTGTFTINGGTIGTSSGSSVELSTNNAQAWNGDFTFNPGASYTQLDMGTGNVVLSGTRTITFSSSGELAVGGVISGPVGAGFTINGTNGFFQMSGNNTYTGTTTIGAGVIVALGRSGGATSGSVAGDIINNGLLGLARSDNVTISNNISGTGNVTKVTSGTTTLTGNNTYSGDTEVAYGTLIVGSATALGASTSNLGLTEGTLDLNGYSITIGTLGDSGDITIGGAAITNNNATTATLTTNSSSDSTYSGSIQNGTGLTALTKSGTGALSLVGLNTFSGGTTLNAGTLNINSNSALGTGTFTINGGTIDNTSGGQVGLSTDNPMNWNGDFTFTGTGYLDLGDGAVVMNGTRTVTLGDGGDALYVGGIISGTSASVGLSVTGENTLILGGNNTYAGTTTISTNSTVKVGFGGTSGSIAGDIVDNGSLVSDRSNNVTLGNTISGTGSFVQVGSGNVTLTGANSYSGGTEIYRGTITLGNASALGSASGFLLVSGSTLDLNGYDTTVGELIDFGSSTGTITNTSVSSNATFTVNGALDSTFGGTITEGDSTLALVKSGSGALTLSGTNDYTGGTTLNEGTLNLSSASPIGTGPLIINGGTIDNLTGDTLDLHSSSYTWSGNFTFAGTNNLDLGTGAVALSGNRTVTLGNEAILSVGGVISGAGAALTTAGNGLLVLSADNTYTGTTTIGAGSLIQLGTSGVTGSVAGDIVNNGGLAVVRSDDVTFNNAISGIGSFTKDGIGNLTLGGVNTSTGTTVLYAGTLTLGNASALGAASKTLAVANGWLDLNGHNLTVGRLIDLDSSSGKITNNAASTAVTFTVDGTSASTFSGDIVNGDGTLALVKSGTGSLTLSGISNYSGGTTLNDGTLNINSPDAIGTGPLTINGGTLGNTTSSSVTLYNDNLQNWNSDFTFTGTAQLFTGAGAVTMSATRTITVTNNLLSIQGSISGPQGAGLIKEGGGDLFLAAANTYTGNTTINDGRLILNNSGTVSTGAIINNGYFAVNKNTDTILANVISGTGNFSKSGTGKLTLTGANTYTGATTVLEGILKLDSASALGTASSIQLYGGTIDLNGHDLTPGSLYGDSGGITNQVGNVTVTADMASDSDLNVNITGNIALIKNNTGILALGGDSTFNGGTTLTNGQLNLNSAHALGTGSLTITAAKKISVSLGNSSGGDVQLTNSNEQFWNSDFTYNSDHNLNLGDGAVLMTGKRTISLTGDGALIVGGAISGDKTATGLTTAGSGALILAGDNLYTGKTTIAAGTTLQLGYGGTSGSLISTNKITNSGTLLLGRTGSYTMSNAISGKGGLYVGTGTVTLSGKNTYSGGTLFDGGTTVLGHAKALGSTKGNLQFSGGALDLNGFSLTAGSINGGGTITNGGGIAATITNNSSSNSEFSGVIQDGAGLGTTALVKAGKGTLMLSGANTFTGTTTIKAGTLQIGNGGSLASTSIVNSGILSVDRSTAYTYSGVISGKGSFQQNGPGTTTLTGANTYTGSTTVNDGTLIVGNITALGTGKKASVTLNAGTLQTNGAIHQINIGGNLDLDSSATIALTLTLDVNSEFVNLGGKVSLLDEGPFVFTLSPSGFSPGEAVFTVMVAEKGFGSLTGEDFSFVSSDDDLEGTFSIVGNSLNFNASYGLPGNSAPPASSSFGFGEGGGPQPVPEPSTWAMLLLGGAVLFLARGRFARSSRA